jgi:hypothetical protein
VEERRADVRRTAAADPVYYDGSADGYNVVIN